MTDVTHDVGADRRLAVKSQFPESQRRRMFLVVDKLRTPVLRRNALTRLDQLLAVFASSQVELQPSPDWAVE